MPCLHDATVNLVQTIIVALCSHHLAILWPSDRDDLSLVMTHLWGGRGGARFAAAIYTLASLRIFDPPLDALFCRARMMSVITHSVVKTSCRRAVATICPAQACTW